MSAPVVLVHGAWGGGWGWGLVQAELERLGVSSAAIDLPSRESAPSTMADDAAAIRAAIAGQGEPAVVVGHSYSGVPVTEAVASNDKVKSLVYVCAVLAEDGQSTMGVMGEDPNPSELGDAIQVDDDGMGTLEPNGAKAILFNDVTEEQAAPIIANLGDLQRRMAGNATSVVEVDSGHMPLLSRPAELAEAIADAAA